MQQLINRAQTYYYELHRTYHNIRHIELACDALTELGCDQDKESTVLLTALWWHCVVYVPGSIANTDMSARLARLTYHQMGGPRINIDKVCQLIRALGPGNTSSNPHADSQLTATLKDALRARMSVSYGIFREDQLSLIRENGLSVTRSTLYTHALALKELAENALFITQGAAARWDAKVRSNISSFCEEIL